MRILVVDDNEDSASILSRLMTFAGHQTQVAFDGESAVVLAADFQPDAVLLDLRLPRMSGYEVARRLRDLNNPVRMRIVAFSGVNIDLALDRKTGIDDLLLKPASVKRILEAIGAEPCPRLLAARQSQ